jgi:putative ABC transport system permease protein
LRPDWKREWLAELATHGSSPRRSLSAFWDAREVRATRATRIKKEAHIGRYRHSRLPHDLLEDARYGLRAMRNAPGLAAAVLVVMALGIGATAAIFSVVQGVVLRPFPYDEPERIVVLWGSNPTEGWQKSRITAADYFDWEVLNSTFEATAIFQSAAANLTGNGDPEQLLGARVSASYFDVLGVQPILGRAFLPAENLPDADPVAILGYGLWRSRFGADPDIIGRDIYLDDLTFRVVGVMPDGLYPTFATTSASLPLRPDLNEIWMPMVYREERTGNRRSHVYAALGRLRQGNSIDQAQADMDTIAAQLEQEYPESNQDDRVIVASFHDEAVGDVRPALLMLLGAVALVLLVACANVAGLLLARSSARTREVAIRRALGASRGRLVRQLLTESVSLAVLGGLLGIAVAHWGVRLVTAMAPGSVPRLGEIGLDTGVLAFTVLISVLTGLVFGLAPSMHTGQGDMRGSLQDGRATPAGASRQGLRSVLVVAEVALAVILVVGAGLLFKSFWKIQNVDPGFDESNTLQMMLVLPYNPYPGRQPVVDFYDELEGRLRSLPGVTSVASAYDGPLGATWLDSFTVVGQPPPEDGQALSAWMRIISPGYFRTVGISLLRGQAFDRSERHDGPGVAVVNESFVRTFLSADVSDPIGQRLSYPTPNRIFPGEAPEEWEIVGVVSDVRFLGPDKDPEPAFYVPFSQFPSWEMRLLMRTESDPLSLTAAVQEQVWAVDPLQPVWDITTLEQVLSTSVADRRLNLLLMGIFGATALALATVGIYGLLAFSVAQRTHEMGIRIALGARRENVLRLVVGQGMTLVAAGLVVGLFGAFALTRVMASLLFEVSATDPVVFAAVALTLAVVALLACVLPARRATRVDPLVALRAE